MVRTGFAFSQEREVFDVAELTKKYVRECFDYSPDTGILEWVDRPRHHFKSDSYWRRCNAQWSGKEAANIAVNGYKRVNINGTVHLVHRIIWLYVFGAWPVGIDHINGDRADNRMANLREATHEINSRNLRLFVTNTSGVAGVSFDKQRGKWHAYIGVGDNARKTLGHFASKEEAAAARQGAERVLGYHENHGRAA